MHSIFDTKHVHLIGIGGISMSSIAHILIDKGIMVSGSDQRHSDEISHLISAGAKVTIGHDSKNIDNPDMVIFTGAIERDNPEILIAQEKGIKLVPRTKALNDIIALHKYAIAISGTHGKSTTTSMVAQILRYAFGDASYMIGAKLFDTKKAYHIASSDFIAIEACEYQANFLNLYPTTISINNIEPEHMDYYKSIEQLVDTFKTFANHLPSHGHLVLNADDYHTRTLMDFAKCKVTTFGICEHADYQAKNIVKESPRYTSFDLYIDQVFIERIRLNLIGDFNVSNALSAIASTHVNGVDINIAIKALQAFQNSSRRFERLGTYHGATVISDYAHHPSEVYATISNLGGSDDYDLCVVFQPHTYSRTKNMLYELASAFKYADKLIITDIYAAREVNTYNIHSNDLVNAIHHEGQEALYIANLEDLPHALQSILSKKTLLIMMGAGNIDEFARAMVE